MTPNGEARARGRAASADLFSLAGKVAAVTGGSRGLGKEMAFALAEAGAKVAISARREQWLTPTAEELTAAGHECLAATCDVSREEEVGRFADAVVERFGRIDVLFNNAGISWGAQSLEMPADRWRQVLDVNATGAFLMSQAAGRHMRAQGAGKIINVSSIMGLRGLPPEVLSAAAYSASKGALIALTKSLAVEWAPLGITVNALAPGFFPTRLSEGVIERSEERLLERIPLRRFGTEADIRGVAVFLASAASDYVTGHVLVLDGGATAL
ncbi:MAG TPA: glucose 1-dehydrogenase [Chloroflexota bacterium]|nr:glucose 1-dehydrogenase [Chloroflexota bacterium]